MDIRSNTFTVISNVADGTILSKLVVGRIETESNVEINEDFSQLSNVLPMPALGEPCNVNYLYNDGAINWNCIQAHNRTVDNPINIPALFRQFREQGQPWVQPIDQYDAYYLGDWVTHSSKSWTSIIETPNVWEPGVVGSENLWDEVTVSSTPTGTVPWEQPTGAYDAYNIGDKVLFNNEEYECLINGNVWSPTAYPAGWNKL